MQHNWQRHGGQVLLADSVGQLRWLDRRACVFCGTIRSQRCRQCNNCGSDTLLRELRVGDTFQDRRQPGHQDAAVSGPAAGQQLPQSSQPVPPGEPLDDSPLPNCPTRDVVLTKRQAAHRASLGLGDGTPAMCRLSQRHGLGRESRRSHERTPVLGSALSLPLSRAPC